MSQLVSQKQINSVWYDVPGTCEWLSDSFESVYEDLFEKHETAHCFFYQFLWVFATSWKGFEYWTIT